MLGNSLTAIALFSYLFSLRCTLLDDKSVNGLRPIHFAALTGKVNFMKFLVERGASPVLEDLVVNDEENKIVNLNYLDFPPKMNMEASPSNNYINTTTGDERNSDNSHK